MGVAVERGRACGLCFLFIVSVCVPRTSKKGESSVPWMACSSGRLSRTRLRVRLPQSLFFTRWALEKSQLLVRGRASVSMSIAPSSWGYDAGDCASGVETKPALEMDVGDASSACLRLIPMMLELIVVVVLGWLCKAVRGNSWVRKEDVLW